ncbi:23S rRNA (adenine(2503)-C(2))-methyltransferase RlmN [Curtanaerobium respiraculi]|jgi:23S rRNA (adenine2503-C2)-methyltransferase|uniref:23S rRNA (adenine(2503)-C(2))-methyltransferase RlmN n=1 Tax=Curtanaerobium respiraculi TaxID=2949669 RepID=UPI0024B39830|nr:23S rRNA (adenine(2503)-C(2))-methyltransferase RlmN [Curtanaerobium respiraculi]
MEPINSFSLEQFPQVVETFGQPRFRARQLAQWLYAKGAESYDQMSNLPISFRKRLAEEVPLDIPLVVDRRVSKDGSRKYLLEFHDGARVEAVGMPSRDVNDRGVLRRLTVCFSTQVGCPMACAFCATGKEGFTRNLLPGEMVQQVLAVQRDFEMRITNAVAMGQGEPFLNYGNLIAALHILNSEYCLNIGARHITVSTCGIASGIEAFAREPEQFTLALSLHSAVQETRDQLMPKVRNENCEALRADLRAYFDASGRRVSLEYLLIEGFNDDERHLRALRSFCRGLHIHINLLPLNDVEGSPFKPSSDHTVKHWMDELARAGIETSLRDSRGADIDGACGQLKNKH